MGPITEHHLTLFLIQFALLLGICKLAGFLFDRLKQSSVTAELLVGVILGPAILGRLAPGVHQAIFPDDSIQRSMLETIAWIGNFFLLMETGLEVNLSRIWKQRGSAVMISAVDLVVPVLISFLPIYLLPGHYLLDPQRRVLFALFIAAIMTISALPVSIRGMRDLNILKTDLGFLIISALTINDIVGWVFFTIILGLFAHGTVEFGYVSQLIVLTLAFTIISLTLIRRWLDRTVTFIHTRMSDAPGLKITFITLVGVVFGAITLGIRIHALFGFFIAGTILGEARHITEKDRFVVNRLVYNIFVPIFFANIGLHLDFIANFDWFLVLLMTVVGIIGRYLGAFLGSLWSRQDRQNILAIAVSHIPGGQMHIVVGMLAYQAGLISETVLVAIITSAILSTVVFGPWLSYAVHRMRKYSFRISFAASDVVIGTGPAEQGAVLNQLAALAGKRTGIDSGTILEEIWKREEQISTAMGNAIALPHARLEGLDRSYLLMAVNTRGIDWDSPDAKPVKLILMILTPKDSPTAQIQILQSLAQSLRNPRLVQELTGSSEAGFLHHKLSAELSTCSQCLLDG
jgi:Kef-type K+ transport system membrane component KefB